MSLLFVAASVSPSAVGDLRSIFYYWRSVLIENARKQAFLGLVFSCFAFFDVFAFRKPSRTGVCGGVLACFYIVCVFSFRQRAVSTYSDRFCREDLHRAGLYGLALPGRLVPDRLYRVGFAVSACAVRPARTRACGGRSHGSLRKVYLAVKHINALNRCFIE